MCQFLGHRVDVQTGNHEQKLQTGSTDGNAEEELQKSGRVRVCGTHYRVTTRDRQITADQQATYSCQDVGSWIRNSGV